MYKTPQQWLKDLKIDPETIGGSSKIVELIDAQQWLDQKYSNKQITTEIIYSCYDYEKKRLIGELVIKDFSKLEKITLTNSGHIITLKIINCPQLKDFECQWTSIKEIDFSSNNKLLRVYICNTLLESMKLPADPISKVRLYMYNNKFSPEALESLENFGVTGPKYYAYSAEDSNKLKEIQSKLWPEVRVEQLEVEESKTASSSVSRKNSKTRKKNQKRKEDKELIIQLEKELQALKLDNDIYHNSNEALKIKNESLTKEIQSLQIQKRVCQTCKLNHNVETNPKK